jgi:hypothetical protein
VVPPSPLPSSKGQQPIDCAGLGRGSRCKIGSPSEPIEPGHPIPASRPDPLLPQPGQGPSPQARFAHGSVAAPARRHHVEPAMARAGSIWKAF